LESFLGKYKLKEKEIEEEYDYYEKQYNEKLLHIRKNSIKMMTRRRYDYKIKG